MFMDASGGMVRAFDHAFRDSDSKSHAVLHTMIWVPVPGGGSPFVTLEQISNDQSAGHLLKAILELQRVQTEVAGRVIKPVRVNMDCGLALLVAVIEGWNRMTVSEYLDFAWTQLRTTGQVDWSNKTIVSWCRTHIMDAIKLWCQTKLKYSFCFSFVQAAGFAGARLLLDRISLDSLSTCFTCSSIRLQSCMLNRQWASLFGWLLKTLSRSATQT